MRIKKVAITSIISFLLFTAGGDVWAASGNLIIRLPWQSKTEVLEYHSCGMADMCWVAEVKEKRTMKRIATLRCDGEMLFSSIGKLPEAVAAENCHRFEGENKIAEITNAMQKLLCR